MHFTTFQHLYQSSSIPLIALAGLILLLIIYIITQFLQNREKNTPFPISPANIAVMILQSRKDYQTQVGYQQTNEGLPKQKTSSYYDPSAHLISFGEDIYHSNSIHSAAEAVRLCTSVKQHRKYPYFLIKLLNRTALGTSSVFTFILLLDGLFTGTKVNPFFLTMYWISLILWLIVLVAGILMIFILPEQERHTREELLSLTPVSKETEKQLTGAEQVFYWNTYGKIFPYGLGILYLIFLLVQTMIKQGKL